MWTDKDSKDRNGNVPELKSERLFRSLIIMMCKEFSLYALSD